jgi:hypothetical protein
MGHARLVCTQLYILFFARLSEDRDTGSFSFQWIAPKGPTLSFLYNHTVEETLMDFSYTFAPNLIHQGASVITEISSAHGDKNSTSAKQQWSHSWNWINFTALKKGKNYTSNQKLKGSLHQLDARAHARDKNVLCAHAHPTRDCPHKKSCIC